jgi:hypothetical protein
MAKKPVTFYRKFISYFTSLKSASIFFQPHFCIIRLYFGFIGKSVDAFILGKTTPVFIVKKQRRQGISDS